MPASRQTALARLRAQIRALETGSGPTAKVLPFGDARLDGCLPGGGLPLGRWHEIVGEGLQLETAAAPAAFAARLAAPLAEMGALVWVLRCDDLFAPGLAHLGFPAERLIQVHARNEAEVLTVLEDALRTHGVAAAFAEASSLSLLAGRRLQLACEQGGASGFILRRRCFGGGKDAGGGAGAVAAATRWRIASLPSAPSPDEPGLGPLRWEARLERCRGGRTGGWILEAEEGANAAHPFRVVADCGLAPEERLRYAG